MSTPPFIQNLVRLGPLDAVAGRPFTAAEHSHTDLAILEHMRAQLRQTLAASESNIDQAAESEVRVQYLHDEDEHMHRMIIRDRTALAADAELTVVGFFGEQRGKANPALLQDIDTELIQEFLQQRYVLSYSSLELADGNWGNLVILQHTDDIEHWRASQRHAYAASELAPLYYARIRLHNGVLADGLASAHLMLRSTKYYDFESGGLWRAIREGIVHE
jgi:hypothetical protein